MKRIILLFLCLFFAACLPHGRTQYFPREGNEDTHALVTIVKSLDTSMQFSKKIVLDGWIIDYIRTGEYIKFHVEPGIHATCLQESPVVMSFEKRKKYYFLITSTLVRLMDVQYECEQIKQEKFEEVIKEKWIDGGEVKGFYKEQDPNLKVSQ